MRRNRRGRCQKSAAVQESKTGDSSAISPGAPSGCRAGREAIRSAAAQGWPERPGEHEGFALALILLLPPSPGSPRWLRREGRVEDAEIAELHEQLDVAVRRIRRLEVRRRELTWKRLERILREQPPMLARTPPLKK